MKYITKADWLSSLGIRERFNKIYRPMLEIKKNHLVDYAEVNNIIWIEDKSNNDINFLRNKVRHKIIPLIKEKSPSDLLKLINQFDLNNTEYLKLKNIQVEIEKIQEVIFLDHKVKRGESLWLIARKYDVRIKDIIAINKLAQAKYIRPGQILQIPADGYDIYRKIALTKSAGTKQVYHTVRSGDTLSEIAQKYGIGLSRIRKWNRLEKTDKIVVGEKLLIWAPI